MSAAVAVEVIVPNERELRRCAACELNQFVASNKNCRRCGEPLFPPRLPPLPHKKPTGKSAPSKPDLTKAISLALRAARLARQMSQAQVADAIGAMRHHVCRIERGLTLPLPPSLVRFAQAFELRPQFLLLMAETMLEGADPEEATE